MRAYVDSSVLLRLALHQPGALGEWKAITQAASSSLAQVECQRTLDRLRVLGKLSSAHHPAALERVRALLDELSLVALGDAILSRASQPFASPLGTLDALHLATALAWQDAEAAEVVFATHDAELGRAARLLGFNTLGA